MLGLGSNDGVRLFLNGEAVWSNHRPRGVIQDSDYVWLSLRQGKNLLLAKVDQGTGGWGLIARFVDPDLVLQRIQTERRLAELSVRQKVESDQVTVWFGNTSPYVILEDVPQFVLSLKDGSGAVLYTTKQSMLEGAVFSTKDLPDGPYWYDCSVTLPSGEVQQQSSFFYKGDTPIRAKVYDRTGAPIWGDVQLLDSDFKWLKEGAEWEKKGVVKILRPDLSPFYLGVLVDSPALGKRWVFYRTPASSSGRAAFDRFACRSGQSSPVALYGESECAHNACLVARCYDHAHQDIGCSDAEDGIRRF